MNATVIPFPARTATHRSVERPAPVCWSVPVHGLIDEIESLFDSGDVTAVIELCRRTLVHLSNSSPDIDDLVPLDDLADRLDDLHLRACLVARPDPLALADWLFDMEVDGELDAFIGAAERYADALGSSGLARSERLLDNLRQSSLPRSDLARRIDEFRLGPTRAALARARHPSAV